MVEYKRKMFRTLVQFNRNETEPFVDPTGGWGTIEHVQPLDGGKAYIYWSVPV